jgi:hypothetical protein
VIGPEHVEAFAGPNAARAMKAALELAADDAAAGCGASDVLFTRRFSVAVDDLAAALPEPIAATFIALAAAEYDYATPDERDSTQAVIEAAGDCPITGIDPWCCPCGRHE